MAVRFSPPPGWPTPPDGWMPPEGWQPDPSWPPLPAGWRLWVEDGDPSVLDPTAVLVAPAPAMQAATPVAYSYQSAPVSAPGIPRPVVPAGPDRKRLRAANTGIVGGLALVLGAMLPFISPAGVSQAVDDVTGGSIDIPTFARVTSALFGAILTLLAVGMRSRGALRPCAITALIFAILGTIGYVGFAAIGFGGSVAPGLSISFYHPNIGLVLSIIGCITVAIAAIRALGSTNGVPAAPAWQAGR